MHVANLHKLVASILESLPASASINTSMSEKPINIGAEFIPICQRHPNANMAAICQRTESKLDEIAPPQNPPDRHQEAPGRQSNFLAITLKTTLWTLISLFVPAGLPASVIEFQAAAQSNANLVHQYTFDGADDDARIEDKKGSADLEIKPYGTGTEDDLGLGETGFDGSSQAVSIFRAEGSDHDGGAALHQPSITLGESVSFEAIFQPSQEEILGGTWNLGYIVAKRVGGDRGYFLIQGEPQPSEGTVFTSTIGGSFSHDNTNRILEPVKAGHRYYAAGSFSSDPDDGTVTFTNYIADLTAGDAALTAVGPFTNSGGTYPIGETTLGIGQRWDAGEAFPGLIDEVNLYRSGIAGE